MSVSQENILKCRCVHERNLNEKLYLSRDSRSDMFILHTTPHTSSPGLCSIVATPPCHRSLARPLWFPNTNL